MCWIQTFTGRAFHPLSPRVEEVDIRDIAHALSMNCRFNGHCAYFYSVAEHSVRVSHQVGQGDALWGLLHDAAEAYLTDLPRPAKRALPVFSELEDKLLAVVLEAFGLTMPMPESVALADTLLLATEARDLMAPPPRSWELGTEPLPEIIRPWTPREAEARFLQRYEQLKER